MERIDKSTYRNDFDVYSKDYLKEYRNKNGIFVPSLSYSETYDKFNAKKYKKKAHPAGSLFAGWLQILLAETEGRCCYCMRKLTENEISVEHLVPENFGGKNEIDEYNFYAGIASEIRDYVELGSQSDTNYAGNYNIDTITKFPHLIAHSNLFPACKKDTFGCSCNNHRGNYRILPMMLMNNVDQIVKYYEDGKMDIDYHEDDIATDTLRALDINTLELKKIRKLWYSFSRIGVNPLQKKHSTLSDVDSLLKQALVLTDVDIIPLEFQDYEKVEEDGTLRKFNLFLQYSWFYDYYTRKYPPQP